TTDSTRTIHDPWRPAPDVYGPPPSQLPGEPVRSRDSRRRLFLPAAALAITALLGGAAGAGVAVALDEDPVVTTNSSGATTIVADGTARTDVGAVALKASPSVVTISVVGRQGSGTGSGVIISEDGYVVTNNHVVNAGAGADITVRLNDGRVVDATVVGTDPTSDLAVIQLEDASGLTPAEWGDSSSLEVGDVVVAIGSPLGLDGTLTSGVISTISRPVRTGNDASSEAVIDAIQHDAPINPGNSGGALLDSQGRLVGINSAIATVGGQQSGNIGVGFAIPSDTARNVAEQIIEQGYAERAYLGVSTSQPNPPAADNGAQVREVVAGGPAQGAGLQVGDVITQVGERRIDDADELTVAVRNNAPGDSVDVTYLRDGQENTVSVTLAAAPRS
ncbi:MAG TPA: trypsin-like peptidase domain-containing protein, partial [Actinomycetes bacterium]|nr:trypsin-like peptidase domain-containing protein [Actinomycetes bacterium]